MEYVKSAVSTSVDGVGVGVGVEVTVPVGVGVHGLVGVFVGETSALT
jgi:hypothetical protein